MSNTPTPERPVLISALPFLDLQEALSSLSSFISENNRAFVAEFTPKGEIAEDFTGVVTFDWEGAWMEFAGDGGSIRNVFIPWPAFLSFYSSHSLHSPSPNVGILGISENKT